MENDNKEAEGYEAFKSGDLAKGIEVFEELLDQSSKSSSNIAELLKRLYRECKEKYLNYPDVKIEEDLLERWSSLLFRVKNYTDGLEILEYILKNINEKNEYVWFKRGSILTTRLDQNDEALACFEKASTINPQFKKALEFKATLLFELDRLKEALQCFDKVLQLDPTNCNALETKGEIYETLGQLDKAMECYMKALSVRTGSEKAEKLKVQIEQLRSQLALRNIQKGAMMPQVVSSKNKEPMNVIIAGTSINGLMLALLCHEKRATVQIFDIEDGSSDENNIVFLDNVAMDLIKQFHLFEELFKRQDGQSDGYLYFKQIRGAVQMKELKSQLLKQCQKRGIMVNSDYSIALITKKALVFKDNKTEDVVTISSFDLVVDCTKNKNLAQELNKQSIITVDNINSDLVTIHYVFKLKKSGASASMASAQKQGIEEETIFWEKVCNCSAIHTILGKAKVFAVACLRTKSLLEVKATSAASKSIDALIDENKHRELGMDIIKPIFGAEIKLLENGSSTKPIQATIHPARLEFKPSLGKWQKEQKKTHWAILESDAASFNRVKELAECIINQEMDEKKFDRLAVEL